MIGGVNLNNFAVDDNGRVTLSGGASGIDFNSAIESIIAARRIPVDRVEADITANTDRITAFNDLKSQLNVLRDRVDALRGKVTVGGAGNIFQAKQVFASTSRTDATAPAAAANLVGVSVTNAAALGTHTLEVLQVAQAQKVSSGAATSTIVDLGTAFGGAANSIAGSFEINGRRIEVKSSDTLIGLADRINTANTGDSATKVSASIVSSGTFQSFLVLTADETGKSITLTDSTKESSLVADKTAALSTYTTIVGAGHTVDIQDATGGLIGTVTYDDTDTLETLGTKISLVAGITASVTAVGAQFRLDIAADDGTSIRLANDSNNLVADLSLGTDILNDLALSSDLGTTFTSELAVAQTARFKADGLIDNAATQSNGVGEADATANLGINGTLAIATPNAGTKNIAIVGGGSLNDIRDDINADADLTAAGITASVVTDTAGKFHLEIRRGDLTVTDNASVLDQRPSASNAALGIVDSLKFDFANGATIDTIAIAGVDSLDTIAANINGSAALQNAGVSATVEAAGSTFRLQINYDTTLSVTSPDAADTALGLARPDLVIERDSNTVTDVLSGITLTLFQAEVGTTIKLDIDRDLAGVKTAVTDFVSAYNDVKSFVNLQQLVNTSNGTASADAGPLFGSPSLGSVDASLTSILGQGAAGLSGSSLYQVLAQVGVSFVDNNAIEDPLLEDTLQIDETVLDGALLNNPEDVRRLFAFDFSASDPQIGLISFTGQTQPATGGYTLDIVHNGTNITSATIDGVPGSVTISGNILTATDQTGANGLKLIYNGTASASGIQLDFSNGLGSQMFFELDKILDTPAGTIQAEIDALSDQNDFAQTRVDEILARLERQRADLLNRFVRMEAALSTINNTLSAVQQQFASLEQNKS